MKPHTIIIIGSGPQLGIETIITAMQGKHGKVEIVTHFRETALEPEPSVLKARKPFELPNVVLKESPELYHKNECKKGWRQ